MAGHISDEERAVAALALSRAHPKLQPNDALRLIYAAKNSDRSLATMLVEALGETVVLDAIAAELNLDFVDLYAATSAYRVADDITATLSLSTLKEHYALPLRGPDGRLVVAMANPRADQDLIAYVTSRVPDERVKFVMAPLTQIESRLTYLDSSDFSALGSAATVQADTRLAPPTSVSDNPVVEWVDTMLARAAAEGASDVHLMFLQDFSLLVRFRIDGTWKRQAVPLRSREREVIGTLLAKCPNIDSSDKTRPQDGTFSFADAGGRRIDARLGMLPQAYGPTIVVRLLDPRNINRRLEDMGFASSTLAQMRRVIRSPQGAIFFIGPTGSGKTTTLYGLLKELPALELNILTAEDPIEYRLPNIGQTQIRSDLGEKSLTFAKTLRAMMRLAPDVILVGEVRDQETATTAMHASLTGHLVLSTVHAKSALGVYSRLEELGVEAFLASEALSLAVNQRLLRRVHQCATLEAPAAGEVAFLRRHGLDIPDLVPRIAPNGCSGCSGTGYRGRLAVVEVLEPSAEVRTMVAERRGQQEIQRAAQGDGYTSILTDAFRHVVEGRTSVAELLRCIDTGGM
jgi:type IV pilus assembly protein PilB